MFVQQEARAADARLGDEKARLAALRRYQILDTPRERVFETITGLVQTVLAVPIAAISLIDDERQWFKSIQGLNATEVARSISFCSHTIRQRVAMVVPDTTADARFARNPLVLGQPKIRAYAGVPLETPDGYNLGSLCAIDLRPREFDARELGVLAELAKLVVDQCELRLLASSDPLTGALSRRAWLEAARTEVARVRRYDSSATMAVLDLDNFKAVNDTHGHPAGDAVLRQVGSLCAGIMRSADSFGRLGGEEFGLLMPAIGADEAVQAVERIRRAIEGLDIRLADRTLGITASFGVAPISRHASVESWIADADASLYRAKRRGRNCTEFTAA